MCEGQEPLDRPLPYFRSHWAKMNVRAKVEISTHANLLIRI
jgi:hypothetical protein